MSKWNWKIALKAAGKILGYTIVLGASLLALGWSVGQLVQLAPVVVGTILVTTVVIFMLLVLAGLFVKTYLEMEQKEADGEAQEYEDSE